MKRILHIADDKRSALLNLLLGVSCAFVAGAINAGGFVIVDQYTSHVTGVIAKLAENLAQGQLQLAKWSFFCVSLFLGGALTASLLIQIAKKLRLHSRFALSLLGSGTVLIFLGWWAIHTANHTKEEIVLILGFFFSMGMQNATVSRLSNAEVRATHMTGVITDIGIELGHWLLPSSPNRLSKLPILLPVLSAFILGGISGALMFGTYLGIPSLFFYGGILVALSVFPVYRDTHIRMRFMKKKQKGIAK